MYELKGILGFHIVMGTSSVESAWTEENSRNDIIIEFKFTEQISRCLRYQYSILEVYLEFHQNW